MEQRVTYEEYRRLSDEKLSKSELSIHLQDRVTYDDLANYLNSHQIRQNVPAMGPPSRVDLETEINNLRQKLDQTLNIVQRLEP